MEKIVSKKGCLIVFILSFFLISCSKSDGNKSDISTSLSDSPVTVNITGTVEYERVPFSSTHNGLDYNNIKTLPVRGAVVEVIDADGNLVTQTATSNTGSYTVTVQQNVPVRVLVYAKSVSTDTAKWNFEVRDNTNNGGLYVMQGALANTESSNSIRNLTAVTGWNGSSYTDTRVSAPFAILDSAYDVAMKIVATDSNANMQEVDIFWSEKNTTASGEQSLGEIGTSYYADNELYILGKANIDTDEFDDHVIIHELGHYFEDNLSRSDNIGGSHSGGSILDMRVALSEGFANAFSGMVTDDPSYRDSNGNSQSSGFEIDVENNAVTNPGWFSESSVQSILYDIYDANIDGDDTIELGFLAIYNAMTNTNYINQTSLTSLFSIIDELKVLNPQSSVQIDALVEAQNFSNSDIFGVDPIVDKFGSGETHSAYLETDLPLYKTIKDDNVPVLVCSHKRSQKFNGLGTRQFLRLNINELNFYNITVEFVPSESDIASDDSDPDFAIFLNGNTLTTEEEAVPNIESAQATLQNNEYILEVYEYSNIDSDVDIGGTACFNVTVSSI